MSIELGLPKYYIAYIFKYHCDLNFNDYKRHVRIYDSMTLIQKGFLKNNTLNALAEFVGFSSYNPFLLSFKQVAGVSPFDYCKNRKVVHS
jgi:YesN/AraC family two-component response regulator